MLVAGLVAAGPISDRRATQRLEAASTLVGVAVAAVDGGVEVVPEVVGPGQVVRVEVPGGGLGPESAVLVPVCGASAAVPVEGDVLVTVEQAGARVVLRAPLPPQTQAAADAGCRPVRVTVALIDRALGSATVDVRFDVRDGAGPVVLSALAADAAAVEAVPGLPLDLPEGQGTVVRVRVGPSTCGDAGLERRSFTVTLVGPGGSQSLSLSSPSEVVEAIDQAFGELCDRGF